METISLHYSAVVKPASSASVGQCVWLVVKLLCRLVGFFIFFGHLFVCSRVAVASVQLFFNCTYTLQFKWQLNSWLANRWQVARSASILRAAPQMPRGHGQRPSWHAGAWGAADALAGAEGAHAGCPWAGCHGACHAGFSAGTSQGEGETYHTLFSQQLLPVCFILLSCVHIRICPVQNMAGLFGFVMNLWPTSHGYPVLHLLWAPCRTKCPWEQIYNRTVCWWCKNYGILDLKKKSKSVGW